MERREVLADVTFLSCLLNHLGSSGFRIKKRDVSCQDGSVVCPKILNVKFDGWKMLMPKATNTPGMIPTI